MDEECNDRHSDQKIREYLRAVEERLVRELRPKGHAV